MNYICSSENYIYLLPEGTAIHAGIMTEDSGMIIASGVNEV